MQAHAGPSTEARLSLKQENVRQVVGLKTSFWIISPVPIFIIILLIEIYVLQLPN